MTDTNEGLLKIDDKWSVRYDPNNNDRPVTLLRYDEECSRGLANWTNEHTAMFYALLEARAERDAARAELARVTEALEACVASLERADTSEGVCCCGDEMDRHSDPMWCGHSPVDMGDYYASKALESARAALTTQEPKP